MIFFRVIIRFQDEFLDITSKKLSEWQLAQELSPYNTMFLDSFEDKKVKGLLQFADMDSATEILGYLAYEPDSLPSGTIDVKSDVVTYCKEIGILQLINQVVFEEVTVTGYNRALDRYGIKTSRVRDIIAKRFMANYAQYDIYGFQVEERIIDGNRLSDKSTIETAKSEAKKLLPEVTFLEELERIYEESHPKDMFLGIPVHYKLTVKTEAAADDMIDFLVNALYLKRRILSRRVIKIFNIEDRGYDRQTITKLFKCAHGAILQIVLNGDVATEEEYASRYHRISELLAENIKQYCGNILCFFVENSNHPGFAKQVLSRVDEDMDIIEIHEGVGDYEQARDYFTMLVKKSNMKSFFKKSDITFEKGKFYSVSEIQSEFNKWRKARLKDRIYSAYDQENIALRLQKEISKKGSAYDELNRMIGLQSVKKVIEDIVAGYKVNKLRNQYYDSNEKTTRHMIFTGAPGTAKTTVARLMAEIMKENGILKTGAFIECGRADLVGRYVGWTAQIVKEKFKEAEGGILFIDEAYSLVEERSGLYGDEAINTIVQEMENKRGDVIVIFAGYPEKMEGFLAKNEGLRSRIAFHVEFPDYNPEELMRILEKMLRDKKYTMEPAAKEKARNIFAKVHKEKEFGNGRFVRNLFEQAVNRQSTRIANLENESISQELLFELRSEDLDTNIVEQYISKSAKEKIGFTV